MRITNGIKMYLRHTLLILWVDENHKQGHAFKYKPEMALLHLFMEYRD